MERAARLREVVQQLQPTSAYLAIAAEVLPAGHAWTKLASEARNTLLEQVRRLGRGENGRSTAELLRDAETLNRDYVAAYAEQHQRSALGPQADDQRRRLTDDPRLKALDTLSEIDLLPVAELEEWKRAIVSLRTCRDFHEGVIADAPICPHCNLRPVQVHLDRRADQVLDQLDSRLSDMLVRWRQALRANLESDTARQSREAMSQVERRPIEQFLAQSDDDTDIPAEFVEAARRALRGISAVTLEVDGLVEALKAGGLPCTVKDMVERFGGFIQQALRGHNRGTPRLTLDR